MSGSNLQERRGVELPRIQTQPSNNVAHPFVSFDDILIDTPDRLVFEDPDEAKKLKEKSKRESFKRAVLKIIAKIRKDKGKGKVKDD